MRRASYVFDHVIEYHAHARRTVGVFILQLHPSRVHPVAFT